MIAIIDYQMGNLRSISKALEEVGGDVVITDDLSVIKKAERIILPGVGAFADGMVNLQKKGLDSLLTEEVITNKKPFWGICLGMQLIASSSKEFGYHTGLNWINATVNHFELVNNLKIPHVGWNTVNFLKKHPLFNGLKQETDFYFVHSYYVTPSDKTIIAGTCNYGKNFVACIALNNIFATQFHPEKSQYDGLKMLENFLTWNPF